MQVLNSNSFNKGLAYLGFENGDDSLFDCKSNNQNLDYFLQFHLEQGRKLGASHIFFKKQLNEFKPQVYIYDFTGNQVDEKILADIQKKIWSAGIVPLVCINFDTEIKILDCTTHIKNESTPVYLAKNLSLLIEANELFNEQFALKIKSGIFWEEEANSKKFAFKNSAYDILIKWIKKIRAEFADKYKKLDKTMIDKIIVQAILIKYLEEKKDDNNKGVFGAKYFPRFSNAQQFTDVLRNKGDFADLLEVLHKDLNGNLFEWNDEEKAKIKTISLSILADALDGNINSEGQKVLEHEYFKYYDFAHIPVELISRLYEEFLAGTTPKTKKNKIELDSQKAKKLKEGIFYTPSHLAQLLVDEAMPLRDFDNVNFNEYKILDPACGSGIFLVLAFKRLTQWWRLKHGFNTKPNEKDLKKLLKCVYGVDKEKQATQLAAFSLCLALCNELSPMQIITHLRFDDLTKTNIIYSDFFIDELKVPEKEIEKEKYFEQKNNFNIINNLQFNIVIGNPPFDRGALKEYNDAWTYENETVKLPAGQIALKFLAETLPKLKQGGLQCLIIKSSSLLYNSTSDKYKKQLFTQTNVVQVLDFTALARNNSLWDGADVATAAIFIKNEKPDFSKNILHLTFRRTKSTKDRILFEIDDYDFHFIGREEAISKPFVWKANLLGGGRIKGVVGNLSESIMLKHFLESNNCLLGEGHGTLKTETLHPTLINRRLFSKKGIVNNQIANWEEIKKEDRKYIPDNLIYHKPNIIISETLDLENAKIVNTFNITESYVFKNRFVGIVSKSKDEKLLKDIYNSFTLNNDIYLFYFLCSSAQILVNLNTSILAYDLFNMPFLPKGKNASNSDKKISNDVVKFFQDFLRHGELSKAVRPISNKEFKSMLTNFGIEFSSVLNLTYQEKNKQFRLSDVVELNNGAFIATIFKYDKVTKDVNFYNDNSILNIEELTQKSLSTHLTATRIIKLYKKDTIILIKPNQYRYWLSLTAYRDADKCFVDLANAGY